MWTTERAPRPTVHDTTDTDKDAPQQDEGAYEIRVLQMVVGGMMVGVVSFSAVAVFVGTTLGGDPNLATPLLIALASLGVALIPIYVVVRKKLLIDLRETLLRDTLRKLKGPRAELAACLPLTIVGAALLEGFGLVGGVVFLLSGAWPAFAAPGVSLIGLIVQFPTRDKLDALILRVKGPSAAQRARQARTKAREEESALVDDSIE